MRQRNGDFEAGEQEADGWSLIRGEVSTEDPHGGRRCVKLHTTEQDETDPMLSSQVFPALISPRTRTEVAAYVDGYQLHGSLRFRGYRIAVSVSDLTGDAGTAATTLCGYVQEVCLTGGTYPRHQ